MLVEIDLSFDDASWLSAEQWLRLKDYVFQLKVHSRNTCLAGGIRVV